MLRCGFIKLCDRRFQRFVVCGTSKYKNTWRFLADGVHRRHRRIIWHVAGKILLDDFRRRLIVKFPAFLRKAGTLLGDLELGIGTRAGGYARPNAIPCVAL